MTKEDLLKEHPHYAASAGGWAMINALMEGTEAMRSAGPLYLPPYKAESAEAHADRLKRSFLFGALRDTIDRHAGKPFGQPVKAQGLADVPFLASMERDADGEGQPLSSFCKTLWMAAESFGMAHIFVDMPEAGESVPQTRAEELAAGLSPRFLMLSPLAVYYWRHERQADGTRRLVELRWKDEGEVHVWTLESWQVYRVESGNGDPKLERQGVNSFGTIPLITCYFNRTGLMRARPPLKALAELNLKHWQDSSDQDNIERTARCGIIFAAGFSAEELQGVSIGPKSLCVSSRPDARLSVVEFSGSSVAIGRDAIKHLESQMETLGLKPELSRSVDSTATGAVINESQATTDLAAWAIALEQAVEAAFIQAAAITGVELPEDFAIQVYRDFSVAGRTQDMQTIVQMGASQLLSAEAVQREGKRRGLLAADHDPEADVAKIAPAGLAGMPAL